MLFDNSSIHVFICLGDSIGELNSKYLVIILFCQVLVPSFCLEWDVEIK